MSKDDMVSEGQWWTHVKRGTAYHVLGVAELQASRPQHENAALVIYRGSDGKIWARNSGEFLDGRFELSRVTPTSAAPVMAELGPPCPNCLRPVQVGQVVLPWDDAGEMHADCEQPYRTDHVQQPGRRAMLLLIGNPMLQVPLAALARPRAAVGEQSREAIARAAADGCDDQHPDGRRARDGEKWWCAYDGAMRALALQSPPAKVEGRALCPACDGTGCADHEGFRMDACRQCGDAPSDVCRGLCCVAAPTPQSDE